jgi:transcriptional regulator GlxA family with amidase domain
VLVRRLDSLSVGPWLAELFRLLRGAGLPVELDPAGLARAPEALARTYSVLGEALSRLDAQPSFTEVACAVQSSERQLSRHMGELARSYGHPFQGWRDFVHEMRLEWATQLLSVPGVGLGRVASLAGYRSVVALCHAFSMRGAETPRTIARRLAEHWG